MCEVFVMFFYFFLSFCIYCIIFHVSWYDFHNKEMNRLMSKVVEAKDTAHPRIAVLMRTRFDHIPPTLFIVAECDPLRDDSYGWWTDLLYIH